MTMTHKPLQPLQQGADTIWGPYNKKITLRPAKTRAFSKALLVAALALALGACASADDDGGSSDGGNTTSANAGTTSTNAGTSSTNSGTTSATNNATTTPPACTTDDDCPGGQVCDAQGQCVADPGCQRDGDCPDGQRCQLDTGACITPECVTSADCGDGQYCDAATSACQDGCAQNADCAAGQLCNPITRACEDDAECAQDADCGERARCREAKCVEVECTTDAHCPLPGEACDVAANACRPIEGYCDSDAACGPDQKCDLDTNACVETGCGVCPEGTTCNEEAGQCWACARDADCDEGFECDLTDHVCVAAGCTSDADCPDGTVCDRISGDCEDAFACNPDLFEPNNTDAAARAIGAGSFTGLTLCEGDEDWFALDLSAGDTLSLQIAFTHTDGNLDVELYDPNARRMGLGTSNTDNETITAGDLALSGTYLIRVFGVNGAVNAYTVTADVEAAPTPTCTDDGFEDNDGPQTASPVIPQTYQALTICPGDQDWYTLRLNPGEQLTATATFAHADGDLDLVIYAPDQTTVLAESRSSTDDETAQTPPSTVSGDVLVQLLGATPAQSNAYQLTFARSEAPVQCDDDRFEPNDASAEPRALEPGLFDDLLICPGNSDWFAVALNAGDDLQVELDFTHADGDLELALYRPDDLSAPIAQSRTRTDGELASFSGAPVSGLYLVRVFGAADAVANAYLMLIERTEAPTECQDDAREDNDNRAQASPFGDETFSGQLCSGDEDWYKLQLNASGGLLAELDFAHVNGDLDLELIGPSGQTLSSSASTTDNTERVELLDVPQSGEYLLRVFGKLGAENAYTLTTAIAPSTCPDDALEDNDNRASAAPLDEGDHPGLTVCSDDQDWFAIDLNAGDGLTATIFFDGQAADLDLAILDDGGRILASSISVNDNEEATAPSVEAAGVYYVRVIGFLGDAGDYDLRLTRIPGGTDCIDDTFEPNDSQARAIDLTTPATLSSLVACPNDDDWFAFDAAPGEIISAALAFTDADGDIDMALLDPNGAQVASATSTSDDEQLNHRANTGGTYLLRVYGFNGDANTYTLDLDVLPANACLEDRFDDNDTQPTAAVITSPGTYPDLALCSVPEAPDDDWYSIFLLADESLTVQLLFTHAQGDLDLELYDLDGTTEVASSGSVTDNEDLSFVAPITGDYFLRVLGYNNDLRDFATEYTLILESDF